MLPTDPKERKGAPMCAGVLDYFPDAVYAVAQCSKAGNDQHNPGRPMHWAKEKSTDHADCIVRHLVDRGGVDTDGIRHSAKLAWRALALLQTELEAERRVLVNDNEVVRDRGYPYTPIGTTECDTVKYATTILGDK